MIRACLIATLFGLLPATSADADEYDPSAMPGTYHYCLGQLDRTLREIDWLAARQQVDFQVQEAHQRYERCLREQPLAAAGGSSNQSGAVQSLQEAVGVDVDGGPNAGR